VNQLKGLKAWCKVTMRCASETAAWGGQEGMESFLSASLVELDLESNDIQGGGGRWGGRWQRHCASAPPLCRSPLATMMTSRFYS
jgi:hypothetical protein